MNDLRGLELAGHLERLGLPERGIRRVLAALAADEAGRATRSGTVNLSGLFPSRKGGRTVQWESKTLELGAHWILECDPAVLAFVDQPGLISYVQRPPDGAARGFPVQLQPDLLVVATDAVYYLDVEPEAGLHATMRRSSGYVVQEPDGRFRRPGAEAEVAPDGLGYRIWTERDVPPILVRNLAYLAPAAERAALDPASAAAIRARVVAEPGVTLAALGALCGADDVQAALVEGLVFVDLARHVLDDPEHAPVFPDQATARLYAGRIPVAWALGAGRPATFELEVGARFAFDGQALTIVLVGPHRVLARTDADGSTLQFERDELEAHWRAGTVTFIGAPESADDPAAAVLAELRRVRPLTEASLREAVRRAEILDAFERRGVQPAGPSLSTIRRWQRDRREIRTLTGDPLLGLVPVRHPGNTKTVRVDRRAPEIARAVIEELYFTPERRSIAACYGQFVARCRASGVTPFSERTFGTLVGRRRAYADAVRRHGRKGAYSLEPPAPIVPDAAPPNGAYPMAVCHIDYTLADIELVDRVTGEPLGRPGLFRLLDGYSGITVALLVGFDRPSARTTLRLLRRCVRNVGRLPEMLVGDLGPEHRNLEVRALAAAYGMIVAWRPAAKPRYGSPLERGFGRLTTEFINGLAGNTQSTKRVRTLTPETDPARRAVWDLGSFTAELERYLALAEDEFDPDLRTSPRAAFVAGLERAGRRPARLVADDDRFRLLTMPYASGISRRIHPVEGVVVEGRSYLAPEFAADGIAFTEGEVRVDDDDVSYVVVLAGGQVIIAHHAASARARVISRAEAAILSEEVRAAWRRSERERPERLARLGAFHVSAGATEAALRAERQAGAGSGGPDRDEPEPAPDAVAGPRPDSLADLYAEAWGEPAPDDDTR